MFPTGRSAWRRTSALTLSTLVVASLAGSGGYAWYLRSPYYRDYCAGRLSANLSLPSDIGGVVPRSWTSREFTDVVVWLPNRRDRAFTCRSALLRYAPTTADPDAYELELRDGFTEISTRTWLRSDYRFVVESGLRTGFIPDGPQRVRFSRMNLAFERDLFRLELNDAAGEVSFEEAGRGRATTICTNLNGHACAEPVFLRTVFSPRSAGIRIDELVLKVPRLPIALARLHKLSPLEIRHGEFAGELSYRELDAGNQLELSGRCYGLDLTECTQGLLATPVRGRCPEIEVRELTVLDGAPQRLRFRGGLRDVELGDLLANLGLAGADGRVTLSVGAAELSRAGLDRLVASGQARDISLERLSRAAGWGLMTGTLQVTIDDLVIENNELRALSATVRVDDPGPTPNWVEGELLRRALSSALKLNLPPVLPERIEYTRFGFTVVVRDEVMELFGSHGPQDKTILTVRLFGRDLGIVGQPESAIDLRPWLDRLRADAARRLQDVPGAAPAQR
jgi:hypothetical protein